MATKRKTHKRKASSHRRSAKQRAAAKRLSAASKWCSIHRGQQKQSTCVKMKLKRK